MYSHRISPIILLSTWNISQPKIFKAQIVNISWSNNNRFIGKKLGNPPKIQKIYYFVRYFHIWSVFCTIIHITQNHILHCKLQTGLTHVGLNKLLLIDWSSEIVPKYDACIVLTLFCCLNQLSIKSNFFSPKDTRKASVVVPMFQSSRWGTMLPPSRRTRLEGW